MKCIEWEGVCMYCMYMYAQTSCAGNRSRIPLLSHFPVLHTHAEVLALCVHASGKGTGIKRQVGMRMRQMHQTQ